MAQGVADGMAYLSRKGFIHKVNILVCIFENKTFRDILIFPRNK